MLPSGWTCTRTSEKWIVVYDSDGQAVIEAFYRVVPPAQQWAFMRLTKHGRRLLNRARWRSFVRLGRR